MANFELPFGDTIQAFSIPDNQVLAVLEGKEISPVADVPSAVHAAIHRPISAQPLPAVIQRGDKVCIIASDITRCWIGFDRFLPSLLNELNAAGVSDQDVTLLVALGAHRPHSQAEHIACYGAETVGRVHIAQSQAALADDFVYAGTTSFGTRAYFNKIAMQADKVILTGGIAFHSMAGFGGGRKSVVPGIARYSTIQENHRLCLSPQENGGISEYTASGSVSDNLMHKDLMEMAAMLKPAFLLNAVMATDGSYACFVAGDWDKAWQAGCEAVQEIYGVPVAAKADIVIASAGGSPKDINLYQGTKAMDNAVQAVKEDGVVILALACPEIGEPPDFKAWFDDELELREKKLRDAFTVPGFVALKCGYDLLRIPHILVTLPQNRLFVEQAGFIYAPDVEAALVLARRIVKKTEYTVIVMPDGSNTVPIVGSIFPRK